jgi:hypothetical protein
VIKFLTLVSEWLTSSGRWLFGVANLTWGLLLPIHEIIYVAVFAVVVDFITGNMASYKRSKRSGKRYRILSAKVWDTVQKFTLTVFGIVFCWALDSYVLPFSAALVNVFASFVIGAEFCSFLENASQITNWTVFKDGRRFIMDFLKKKTDVDLDVKEK